MRLPSRRITALVAAYVAVTLVMTWPFVNYGAGGEASYGSDMSLIVWTLAWDNHALLTRTPLFDSNIFFPAAASLRYNEHLFGLSLFTLPWAAAGASPVLAHNVIWWLAFPLNGLAAFALLRRFVASDSAAFAGSLAYAFSFYVMLHAGGHLHLIWLWPLPLSLLLLERWFDAPSPGRVAGWAAVVLLQSLTSWYLAVMVLLVNALMGAVLVAFPPAGQAASAVGPPGRGLWPRRAAQLAAAGAVLALCMYPFARPYVGIASATQEISANVADVASYVVPPQNTVVGHWWLTAVNEGPRGIFGEQTLFAGWLALLLAGGGTFLLLRRVPRWSRRAWIFLALAGAGFLISLGPVLPVVGPTNVAPFNWLAALPGLDGLRAPARFAAVAMLGVAGLVAVALDALARRAGARGPLLIAGLVPLMLLEWFVVDFPAGSPVPQPVPAIYRTPQVQSARSLVSLPDYRGTDEWFRGADYLYYATAHWRPIVNGFGRTEPPGHAEMIGLARAFPISAPALNALGVQYVVVHGDRFADGAGAMVAAAQERADCHLVAQVGNDYLFEIAPPVNAGGAAPGATAAPPTRQ